jgi:hypothetical protein
VRACVRAHREQKFSVFTNALVGNAVSFLVGWARHHSARPLLPLLPLQCARRLIPLRRTDVLDARVVVGGLHRLPGLRSPGAPGVVGRPSLLWRGAQSIV